MNYVKVTAVNIYPVKSMKAIPLRQARLTPLGLEHDRRWMVVRDNGRFVTQREINRLALVRPQLTNGHIVLAVDGHGSIEVPSEPPGPPMQTAIWGDECKVVSAGERISDWLTEYLQSRDRLHLVRMAPGFTRPQNRPDRMGSETRTVFADAAPYLVASEASLEALNRELAARALSPVPMNRFRPNVVVRGLAAFQEHGVAMLSGSDYALRFRAPCERCVVTTIDQDTAEHDPQRQPFRTLVDINPMPGNPRGPAFAENATLEAGNGAMIAVGDRLQAMRSAQ
jgi:hypothetical protein